MDDLYRDYILEHYRRPHNFGVLEGATTSHEGSNPLCGDRITLQLRLADGKIAGVGFTGRGCAISQASASLLTDEIKGKRIVDAAPDPPDASYPFRLVRAAAFEWGDDPLVAASPTLRRDHVSLRKLFPRGRVDLPTQDARALGIRDGWQVKLVSRAGEALVPVTLRDDLAPRTVLVPFAFRDQLAPVLGAAPQATVRVERV